MSQDQANPTDGSAKGTLLVISQVYVPDPASVGQHVADAAAEMARRGWRVRVLAAANGYDDPSQKYPKHEVRDGVEIRRLPFSSFGKSSILLRLVAGTIFMLQCIVHGLFTRGLKNILVSTSPPMCSLAAIIIRLFRRGVSIKYWVMDLNPDQMIELGMTSERSLPARVFNWMNRRILKTADDVIALDRFMAERLNRKRPSDEKITILPPWPHEDHLGSVSHEENQFRKKHALNGKFVIMYSGNHSIASPMTTVLQASLKMQEDDRVVFMFIGGGLGKKEVEQTIAEHQPKNIVSLPYQPLSEIKYSLSAADVHLVSMGDAMVGVIHPCKIYGAMAVARPVLLLGPDPCHASEIISDYKIGWTVQHGDVDGTLQTLRRIIQTHPAELREMGERAQQAINHNLSKRQLCGDFCDVLERRPSS